MNVKTLSASANATLSGQYRIKKVRLVAGADAATAIFYDAATATGTSIFKLSANAANGVDEISFVDEDGVVTTTGLSVTVTGTTPLIYIFYS